MYNNILVLNINKNVIESHTKIICPQLLSAWSTPNQTLANHITRRHRRHSRGALECMHIEITYSILSTKSVCQNLE